MDGRRAVSLHGGNMGLQRPTANAALERNQFDKSTGLHSSEDTMDGDGTVDTVIQKAPM